MLKTQKGSNQQIKMILQPHITAVSIFTIFHIFFYEYIDYTLHNIFTVSFSKISQSIIFKTIKIPSFGYTIIFWHITDFFTLNS